MTDELKRAIIKLKDRISESVHFQEDLNEASWGRETGILITRDDANVIVSELEKPTYTPADMEEFSYWYHRKVSVIGESELHLFGVRPFEDIISFWKKEKEATK